MLEEDNLSNEKEDNNLRISKMKREVDARLRFGKFLELVIMDGDNAYEELKYRKENDAIDTETL